MRAARASTLVLAATVFAFTAMNPETQLAGSVLPFAGMWAAPAQPGQNRISAHQFRLLLYQESFSLQFVANGKSKRLAVPRDWLIPVQAEKDEESTYVTSFNYDKEVSSFPIGNGRLGLHLSSYKIQEQGSAQAAAGRDVFLIFDPSSSVLSLGGLERGITKQRARSQGCFSASAEHYFLGDIDGDGLTDIGVLKEELACVEDTSGDGDRILGPFYNQYPVTWYVFKIDAWKLDPKFSGKFPEHYQELPLVGITRSPVDSVGCNLWQTCDRAKWPRADKHQQGSIP